MLREKLRAGRKVELTFLTATLLRHEWERNRPAEMGRMVRVDMCEKRAIGTRTEKQAWSGGKWARLLDWLEAGEGAEHEARAAEPEGKDQEGHKLQAEHTGSSDKGHKAEL